MSHSKMKSLLLVVFCTLWGSLSTFFIKKEESTLELVHVVFRHGDRNPELSGLWDSNPYKNESFYPEGFGQLTKAGKKTEYKLGQQLRKRYNRFLGPTWNINTLDVRTTDFNRTKMSAELMLAGLFPPSLGQRWSLLDWQPIPYNYFPVASDLILSAHSVCLGASMNELTKVVKSDEISSYIQDRYNETLEILGNRTGSNIFLLANGKYFGMAVQEELGFKLEDWTKAVYPEPLRSLAVDNYYLWTNTTELRRVLVGHFIKKILSDTKTKIDGTITPSERKMFVYSAHEINIAYTLLALDAYKITSIPNYGSYLLFEVHRINEVWGLKMFFQNYEASDPLPVKLPGCDYFCPYEDFHNLVEEILPESDSSC